MSISTFRRQFKNVAYNFSDAQVKVRNATSNDPWSPSIGLMSEIADLTNNSMAFIEIMGIIWKRLSENGRNWRHVYKSLILLEYLIKCGSDKVANQCRDNICTLDVLRDFQLIEDHRNQNDVREKAKQILALLADAELLKNERMRFMLARNKMRHSKGKVESEETCRHKKKSESRSVAAPISERPTSAKEEELQLQVALALSREEAEKMDELEKSDDAHLQMIIEESMREADEMSKKTMGTINSSQLSQNAIDDLLSLGLGSLTVSDVLQPTVSSLSNDIALSTVDPWSPLHSNDAAQYSVQVSQDSTDSWASSSAKSRALLDAILPENEPIASGGTEALETISPAQSSTSIASKSSWRVPKDFLGENSALVNFDNLFQTPNSSKSSSAASTPYFTGGATDASSNPFNVQRIKNPSINELRTGAPPIPQGTSRISDISCPGIPVQSSNHFTEV